MSANNPNWTILDRIINIAQLCSILAGIAVLSFKVGTRDQIITNHDESIKELKGITADLAKTQVSNVATDATTVAGLSALRERLDDLTDRIRIVEGKR